MDSLTYLLTTLSLLCPGPGLPFSTEVVNSTYSQYKGFGLDQACSDLPIPCPWYSVKVAHGTHQCPSLVE